MPPREDGQEAVALVLMVTDGVWSYMKPKIIAWAQKSQEKCQSRHDYDIFSNYFKRSAYI